jgi:hypothetical protein
MALPLSRRLPEPGDLVAEPCQVVVATRTDDTGPLVAEFIKSAVKFLVRPN